MRIFRNGFDYAFNDSIKKMLCHSCLASLGCDICGKDPRHRDCVHTMSMWQCVCRWQPSRYNSPADDGSWGLRALTCDLTIGTGQSTEQYRWWTEGPGRQVRYHGSDLTIGTGQSTEQYRWCTEGPGRQVRYHGSDLTLVTGLNTEQYR